MENRPTGLTVLCVLSWVWLALVLYSFINTVSVGQLTDEQILEQKIVFIESQPPELLQENKWIVDDMVEILEIAKENYVMMIGLEVAGILIGFAGVFFMFKMRKLGFHLYIIYTVLSIFYWLYFYLGNEIGFYAIAWSIVMGGLFVGLYAIYQKRMT